MTEPENRPSPDALLKEAKTERNGKLKVFLGAAPGVGKTYAMLGAAKARIAEGIDTVIGIVETHQRSETQALSQGMEVIPRQKIAYRGLNFEEMDIDAILKRKPKLVLVDELAHTNIPGARHTKRCQDVQEILEAGIDVYTTLNVQHIESLNDIVARITGVKVRETIPDSLVQMANAIELIDLPPDELLQRLKEGKVYIPEQARLAVNRFFTPGNLTALRELALRQAAERVDDQMASLMRRHAIAGPWPTSNRMMVCISDDGQAAFLVRTARRAAERRQAAWIVLHVETSQRAQLSEKDRTDVSEALALAETLGAEALTVSSENPADEILRIARERNVSTILLGKSNRSFWSRLMWPSVSAAVIKNSEGFDVHLINNMEAGTKPDSKTKAFETQPPEFSLQALGKASFILSVASLIAALTSSFLPPFLLLFFFIAAILLVALDTDLTLSLFATLVSAAAFDVLLVGPNGSLLPTRQEDILLLLFFLVTGGFMAFLCNRTHIRIDATRRLAERTQSLYDFTKSIAAAATTDDVAQTIVRRIGSTLSAHVAVLTPRNENLAVVASVPADLSLDTASSAAMDWVYRHRKPAGFRSDTLPGAPFYGLPLQAGANVLGVIAVQVKDGSALTAAQNNFLVGLSYQAAAAIERTKLVTDVEQARLQSEMEKLRTSLLSSVSRDMREPLDSIILTARRLNGRWDTIPAEERLGLVNSIEQESDRLDRFIENFLDMTELVTGNIRLRRTATNVQDVMQLSMARLYRHLKEREVRFDCPEDLPMIEADPTALRRVFVNVLENACAYSLPDQPIKIEVTREAGNIRIAITDRGIGIPETERERVFDMFYRIKKETSETATTSTGGAGLGLSICRGFIEAHRGTISAYAGDDGLGTTIIITLPLDTPAA